MLLLTGCDVIKKYTKKIPSKLPGIDMEEEQQTFGGTGSIDATIINPKKDGTILSGYPLETVVRITNLGGSESEGQTCITGPNQDIFSGFSGCECLSFQQIRNDEGKFESRDLKFGPYQLRDAESETPYSVTSITRYKYATDIKAETCIVQDMYETEDYEAGKNVRDVCEVDIMSVTSGPLEVYSIEEIIIPIDEYRVTMIFNIYVGNEGKGNLWSLERLNEQCAPSISLKDDEKKIRAEIKGFPVSGDLMCQDATLDKDEEAMITCEAKEISLYSSDPMGEQVYLFGDDYRPEITFELEYAYETRTSNSFTIR